MNQPNGPQSFMDTKTIAAIIMVGACWLGWQAYMQKKYPHLYQKQSSQTNQVTIEGDGSNTTSTSKSESSYLSDKKGSGGIELSQPTAGDRTESERPEVTESFVVFDSPEFKFQLSSKGMGLSEVVLNEYTLRDQTPIQFKAKAGVRPFETRLVGHQDELDFNIEKLNQTTFLGRAEWGNLTITKLIEVFPSDYVLKTKVSVEGKGTPFLGLMTFLVDEVGDQASGSFLLPQFERQEFFVIYNGKENRDIIELKQFENAHKGVSLAAVGDQYFAQAVVDKSQIIPDLITRIDDRERAAIAQISYPSMNKTDGFEIEYHAFVGPKYLRLLEKVDSSLPALIDYGFFSWLARPILHLLTWFHSMTKNWGVAIILLTLFVRLLVMPLYVMSFRSMNKMKLIQPELTRLREKYKDDPTRMNQEVMTLMKSQKVNPLGGCLPMLLQFPVFIALYSVLGHSIELYQAPFVFWVQDLSLKDPFYVFPVLMGITMFLQQKLTPTTLDPVQAKVFLVMPVIFSLFMLGLPSGLTLYIFVSALFGVIQQLIFMKDQPKQLVVEAKA